MILKGKSPIGVGDIQIELKSYRRGKLLIRITVPEEYPLKKYDIAIVVDSSEFFRLLKDIGG